ncbi:MAG: peptidylprolyl isomerase [Deltaproteobacteria bacterium]|jgi:cyclophilin family peptidyl-prolyl cis-trans isomerase|nr:peptidylprolyl isomerase [Deltaproteobacteria bacterium]
MSFQLTLLVALFAAPLILLSASGPLAAQEARDQAGKGGAPGEGAPAGKRPLALFQTSKGNFEVELFSDLAPKTVDNFVSLANKKYYDGTIFHRVISDFMIQGGDPTGTGTGGPGYVIKDEFGAGLSHDAAGTLSMANAGPDTGGSQFFITLVPTKWLDGKHAVFGKVVKGMDVVQAIGAVKTNQSDRPLEEVRIISLAIKSAAPEEAAPEARPQAPDDKAPDSEGGGS